MHYIFPTNWIVNKHFASKFCAKMQTHKSMVAYIQPRHRSTPLADNKIYTRFMWHFAIALNGYIKIAVHQPSTAPNERAPSVVVNQTIYETSVCAHRLILCLSRVYFSSNMIICMRIARRANTWEQFACQINAEVNVFLRSHRSFRLTRLTL